MKKNLLFLFCLWTSLSYAQDTTALHFAQFINQTNLYKHLHFLASDELQGRQTGTKGQKKAATYISNHFQQIGLLPLVADSFGVKRYQQPFLIKRYFGHQYSVVLQPSRKDLKAKNIIRTENIIGLIEGSEQPQEYIVISAHYDHLGTQNGVVFNGADDDASGTSCVLALAEAFAQAQKAGFKPKKSLLFMTVTGEEMGLLGSEYFTEKPIIPLSGIKCNLNIDMVGRIDPFYANDKQSNYVYVIGSDKISMTLDQILNHANQTYTHLTLDYSYNSDTHPLQLYYRSDHYNFAKHQIPVVFFTNGEHEDYHRSTDDTEKIDFPLLEKRAKLIFFTAWEIANGERKW